MDQEQHVLDMKMKSQLILEVAVLGGGTIRGLCKLAAQVDDPEEIDELSKKGSQIGDYVLKDVVSGPIGSLPEDSIAVHLGNLDMMDKLEKEDICKSIIYLVATNIARLSCNNSNCLELDKVVVVGRSPNYSLYKEVLKRWIEYSGLEVVFMKDGEVRNCNWRFRKLN